MSNLPKPSSNLVKQLTLYRCIKCHADLHGRDQYIYQDFVLCEHCYNLIVAPDKKVQKLTREVIGKKW